MTAHPTTANLTFYNAMSRRKEIFEPLEAGKVKLSCCGYPLCNSRS